MIKDIIYVLLYKRSFLNGLWFLIFLEISFIQYLFIIIYKVYSGSLQTNLKSFIRAMDENGTVELVCVLCIYLEKWMADGGVSLYCDRKCEINWTSKEKKI